MSTEGKIGLQSDFVPVNDNPRQHVVDVKYIKGGPVLAKDVTEFITQHPARLKFGNIGTIFNYPRIGMITDFRLTVDPSTMVDSTGASIVTVDNFAQYWSVLSQTESKIARVYQFAPDGPGGGAPIFPYTLAQEPNWVNTRDDTKGHKWMRFRDDDIDDDSDGIFDNWSVPIPITAPFQGGDFIENRFRRQVVSLTVHTGSGTLIAGKYYVIDAGRIQIDGDLSLNDIGEFGEDTSVILALGRVFKYDAANTYTFLSSATVTETLRTPPRTVGGIPNNEPTGWFDTPPVGTDQLWEISGQKSVYQQLKSDWILKKIIENPNYVRYSDSPSPHPDTLAGPNSSANPSSSEDLALIAAGWDSVYDNQSFIATRSDDPGPDLYTSWLVEKINEESGEYTDIVFKLFDFNLDADSIALTPPSGRDATKEGWFDVPQQETETQINYTSQARKFFNGELKTPWSQPVPYTGKDSFNDTIDSDLGDSFKYESDGVTVAPAAITLQANLYKGTAKLWESDVVGITYVWLKVYDGGAAVSISPTTNPADPFYLLASTGTPGTDGYLRDDQRVVVKPTAVDGNAVFRVTQTLAMVDGDDVIFEEEFSIIDITDGKDAKQLLLTSDKDTVIWDQTNSVFVPATIILRAYQSNLLSPTYYWYKWNGTSWDSLTLDTNYSIATNVLSFDPADIFASDDTAEEGLYAVSTHATNPDSADYSTTFSDFKTIAKLSAAAVGADGENAVLPVLDNEAHTIIVSSVTGSPAAGEIGIAGKARTLVALYDGLTKKIYGSDYTLGLASDNASVTFAQAAAGDDGNVYISVWTAGERRAVCTITITYGSIVMTKKFSVASTQDAPGAVLLDVDSNKGFVFTPDDKSNKTFTARLYDTALLSGSQQISLPDALYTFRWKVAGVFDTATTGNFTKTVTRANILTNEDIICEVYKSAVLYRSRTVKVSDVNDGKAYRAWTDSTSVSGGQKLTNQDPTTIGAGGVTVSGVTWRTTLDTYWLTHTPIFSQEAEQDPNTGTWSWSAPVKIKGEKGDQGVSGNFFFPMYKANPTSPAFGAGGNTSSLAQMITAGWTSFVPASGIIWRTERQWIGEGVSFNGAGDPSTSPVVGSVWVPPVRLSASDGTNGNNGAVGTNGWSPVYQVITDGPTREVLQLIDWIGGTGTKPGNIGYYVASSGFVPTAALAKNIRGSNGADGATGFGEVVYENSGAAPATGVILNFSTTPLGQYLMLFEISAQDSGAAGMFSMSRIAMAHGPGYGYDAAIINLMGDGSASIKPQVTNSSFVHVNAAAAGINRITINYTGSEIGGYSSPQYRVLLIRLKP